MSTKVLLIQAGLGALLLAHVLRAQESKFAACPSQQSVRIGSVQILRPDPSSKKLVAVDTLVFPNEDSVFLGVGLLPPEMRQTDSTYLLLTVELLLHSAPTSRDPEGPTVVLPSKVALDTIVSVAPPRTLTLGPIATEALIPWPEGTVTATANANPWGARVRAAALQVHRSVGEACLARLEAAVTRSRTVILLYDP